MSINLAQSDPAEGSREVIDRELARSERRATRVAPADNSLGRLNGHRSGGPALGPARPRWASCRRALRDD